MQSLSHLPNLPPAVGRSIYADLCRSLPLPLTDSASERADRDETAISAVAALQPGDAFQADLAASIVVANAHAMDCLRSAVQPSLTPEQVGRCRAQAAKMMRLMQSGLRQLRQLQGDRERTRNLSQPTDRTGASTQGIAIPPAPIRTPPPAPTLPARTAPPPPADIIAEAERYAAIHPKRAALIRRRRGLPPSLYFAAPAPAIVQTIVTGTTPRLRALDKPNRQTAAAA